MGQEAAAEISVSVSGSMVDSHPYGIISAEGSQFGYCTIAGDVTPFGESVESYANYRVAELDLHSLEVIRTFEVGYYPTELLLHDQFLYVTCSNDPFLYQIDLQTGAIDSFAMTDSSGFEISFLSGLNVDANGNVVVASNGGSFDGSNENVVVFDPVTESIVNRIDVAGAITRFLIHDGLLVIPVGYPENDFSASPVVRWIDPDLGTVVSEVSIAVDTADFPGPSDISDLGDGTAVLTVFGGSAEVFVLDLDSRVLTSTWPVGGTDFSQSAALPLLNGNVLISDLLGGWIKELNPLTGDLQPFGDNVSQPVDMVLKDGRIFVTEQGLEQVSVFLAPGSFIRGDSNGDRIIDVGDPIALLGYLFLSGSLDCLDSGDFNDDGLLDLSDAVGVLGFLFSGGADPSYPYPVGGADLQEDSLDCENGA